MKFAVLSDVHGNLPALKAVLDCVDAIAPDAVLVAGDLIGGPDFNETTALLKDLGSLMVPGNMDLDLLKFLDGDFSPGKRASQQWGFMRWQAKNAARETIELLRALPVNRQISLEGVPPILVVHGSPRNPYESLFPDRELERLHSAVDGLPQSVLVCGHIHVQWSRRVSGKLLLNPGAVSASLQGDALSRFTILRYEEESWRVEPQAVAYDVGALRDRYRDSGLLDAGGVLSKAILMACETGKDVAGQFYSLALEKARKQALDTAEFIPDEVWQEAEQEFPWSKFKNP
jgi:putative phosphoesterase